MMVIPWAFQWTFFHNLSPQPVEKCCGKSLQFKRNECRPSVRQIKLQTKHQASPRLRP